MLRSNRSRPSPPTLTALGLRNFKAFGNEEQLAPMSRITLIYGPNSGGKSSVIQSLLLLKQSQGNLPRAAVLAPRGEYVDLAGFKAMVHRHNEDDEVEITVSLTNNRRDGSDEEVHINLTFGKDTQHLTDLPVLARISYELKRWGKTDLLVRLKNNNNMPQGNQATATFIWDDDDSSIESFGDYLLNSLREMTSGDRGVHSSFLNSLFPSLAPFLIPNVPYNSRAYWTL